MSNVIKPPKPYPDFPLTAHPNGQWCKKVRGRLHYFGPWSDPNGALNLFLDHRDDLFAGRTPRPSADGVTLAGLSSADEGARDGLSSGEGRALTRSTSMPSPGGGRLLFERTGGMP